MARRKGANLIALAVMLVSGVIGYVVLDSIITDAVNVTLVGNETVGTANASGYLSGTLDNIPVVAASETIRCAGSTVAAANYTLTDATGALVVNDIATCASDPIYAAYGYEDSTYYSSSLSRTIVTYIVPIGILGLFAIAAFGVPI